MKTFDQTCREIHWPSLSEQKQTLLKLRATSTRSKDKKNLNGILKLIDKLQDAALDAHGVPESKVFPSLNIVRLVMAAKKNKN